MSMLKKENQGALDSWNTVQVTKITMGMKKMLLRPLILVAMMMTMMTTIVMIIMMMKVKKKREARGNRKAS